jgi:hypothetical protein
MLGPALVPLAVGSDAPHSYCALSPSELNRTKSLRVLGEHSSKLILVGDQVHTYTYDHVDVPRLVEHLNRSLRVPLKRVTRDLYMRADLVAQITTVRDARKRNACLSTLTPLFATESEHDVCFASVVESPHTVAHRLSELGLALTLCSMEERACYVNPKTVRVVIVGDILDASVHAQQLLVVSADDFDALALALDFAPLCPGCAVDPSYLATLRGLRGGYGATAELVFADLALRLPAAANVLLTTVNAVNAAAVRKNLEQRLLPVPAEIEDQVLSYVYD